MHTFTRIVDKYNSLELTPELLEKCRLDLLNSDLHESIKIRIENYEMDVNDILNANYE